MELEINNYNYHYGTINIYGAKNSALPIICAMLLLDGTPTLYNVPHIKDIEILLDILKELNVEAKFKNHTLQILTKPTTSIIKSNKVHLLRGSYYLYGTFLSLFNHVFSSLPGGCNLGKRPINYHLDGFHSLGCEYILFDDYLEITSVNKHPGTYTLEYPSIGATINLILSSVKTPKVTIIKNASFEPEVLDLINFLNHANANIKINDNKIIITGTDYLKEIKYKLIPDRIEAGSYMFLGLCPTFKYITINNVSILHLKKVLEVLKKIGAKLIIHKNKITIITPKVIYPINLVSDIYPAFPTDLIQIASVILSKSFGLSTFKDNVFENRYSYLEELTKLNFTYKKCNDKYILTKEKPVNCATIICQDLRGAFALLCACFMNFGTFKLQNIDYIFRGYNDFLDNLQKLKVNFSLKKL